MKVLKINMTVYREDDEDFDESILGDFTEAIVDVIEDFDLRTFAHMKVMDDDDEE